MRSANRRHVQISKRIQLSCVLSVSAALFAACGNDAAPVAADGGGTDGSDAAAGSDATIGSGDGSTADASDGGPDFGQTAYASAIARSWTMPSESEGYKCVTVAVTADMDITSLRPTGLTGVSGGMLTVLAADAGAAAGPFDCSAGTVGNRLLMAFGSGSGEVALPPGASMHVAAGEILLLTLHLDNPGAAELSGTTGVEVRQPLSTASITRYGEAFLSGTYTINDPSDGVTHTAMGQCVFANARDIFAITPLMRTRGVGISIARMPGDASSFVPVLDASFAFGAESVAPISPATGCQVSDTFRTICSYNNDSGTTASYGEADSNEECFGVIYSTKNAPANAVLDSCAKGQGT